MAHTRVTWCTQCCSLGRALCQDTNSIAAGAVWVHLNECRSFQLSTLAMQLVVDRVLHEWMTVVSRSNWEGITEVCGRHVAWLAHGDPEPSALLPGCFDCVL